MRLFLTLTAGRPSRIFGQSLMEKSGAGAKYRSAMENLFQLSDIFCDMNTSKLATSITVLPPIRAGT